MSQCHRRQFLVLMFDKNSLPASLVLEDDDSFPSFVQLDDEQKIRLGGAKY